MIIVTGGAGFIGSNIVHALNLRGETNILIVDNLGSGDKYKNICGLKFSDFMNVDDFFQRIQDDEFYLEDEVDAVFHEGACSDTMERDADYIMKVNFQYSKALLEFCIDEEAKFIYASSASVYGNGQNGFRENISCERALNAYALSKMVFDMHVRKTLLETASEDFYTPPIVGLRYFNVYGAQEQHKGRMASIVYQMYNQVKDTGVIKLFKGSDGYDDGEQRRDFISVDDVVKVNLWAFDNEEIASGIYNCGTGQAHTFNETAQAVIAAMGTGCVEYIDFPDELQGKYQSFTQADTRKLLRAGYNGGFSDFQKSIAKYCKFLDAGGYFRS